MRDKRLFILLFTGIWCLVGLIFVCVGIGMRRAFLGKEERLRARAPGVVAEVVRRKSGDSVSFFPIVEFEHEGRRIQLESDAGGGRKKYYEGQPVEVLYDPDDPSRFRLEGENGFRLAGNIMLAVGLGCVGIGAVGALLASALPF